MEFHKFPSIPRLSRDIVITEKLDGTNASITITEDGEFLCGSRTRFITPEDDNFGFARWANENKDELMKLGVGTHFGEWWGKGIQIGYGLDERRFSLFNTHRWNEETKPKCCHVVPVLAECMFYTDVVDEVMNTLWRQGSQAAPGWMAPEGIVIYHKHGNYLFKKTFKNDEAGKSYGS